MLERSDCVNLGQGIYEEAYKKNFINQYLKFLFSMMTKAQDKVVLGFLIHGVNLILNKGMTGIWRARRYWLFFYIEEPIYPSVYHVFGGGQDYFLQSSFFIASSSA